MLDLAARADLLMPICGARLVVNDDCSGLRPIVEVPPARVNRPRRGAQLAWLHSLI
jgi:hypothetical protein